MLEPLPKPLLDLQAVFAGAEITLRRIATEVATARAKVAPLLPTDDDADDASEVPGLAGWALSLDGSAQQLVTTLCESVLVELDRARRSSPTEPSPAPWPWVGEQALAAARRPPAGFESESSGREPGSTGVEVAG